MMMLTLTPLELKVMTILWEMENAFVKDILEKWKEKPKPAYNTISTVVRILENKGAVGHKAFGKTHRYYPIIGKENYQKQFMKNAIQNLFGGSVSDLITTMLDNKNISEKEMTELKKLISKLEKND